MEMNCRVMGIVNVTPDSFSDGGKYYRPEEAVRRARNCIEEGAEIIDLGGESTRPDATPIGWEEEWGRIEPVLAALAGQPVVLSVDTYHPETAERALAAGARLVNCVFSEPLPAMYRLLDRFDSELILPAGARATVPPSLQSRVYLDPMIGFGTTREEDLALLKGLPALAETARVAVGVSRKRIVRKLTGEKLTGRNLGGSLALGLWCARQGASILRVHDVRETVQGLRVLAALG